MVVVNGHIGRRLSDLDVALFQDDRMRPYKGDFMKILGEEIEDRVEWDLYGVKEGVEMFLKLRYGINRDEDNI